MRSTYIRIILRVRVRAYYMYGTTAKFKSANIFISAARDQTAKFKDRQYFRLYGSTYKIIATCIERATELRANNARVTGVTREYYKAGQSVLFTIDKLMSGFLKKLQNSELKDFPLQLNCSTTLISKTFYFRSSSCKLTKL